MSEPAAVEDEDVFAADRVGVWSDTAEFEVTRERMVAYAEATNDALEQHLAGEIAPPVFAVVAPFTQMAMVTMEVVPPHLMLRVLHGEQDIRIHRPIVAGDWLTTRGKVVGIHGKPSGVVVTTLIETRDAAGKLVNEQYFAGFFRGGNWPHAAGAPSPAHTLDPATRERRADATRTRRFDDDQTWRYAEASGDPMPIHTDEAFARSMGLPGIIVHGLCTMAFTSQDVIAHACPDDPARLRRIAVRFAAPGRPGRRITTSVWETARGRVAFETADAGSDDDARAVLIKDGLAEIGAS